MGGEGRASGGTGRVSLAHRTWEGTLPEHSHGAVHHSELAGEVDGIILDGQQDVLDLRVAPTAAGAPFQVHSELLVGVPAVRGEVVDAQPGEAEDVSVEGLVVGVTPRAADAVAVVPGPAFWGAAGGYVSSPCRQEARPSEALAWQRPSEDPPEAPRSSSEPVGVSAQAPGRVALRGSSAGHWPPHPRGLSPLKGRLQLPRPPTLTLRGMRLCAERGAGPEGLSGSLAPCQPGPAPHPGLHHTPSIDTPASTPAPLQPPLIPQKICAGPLRGSLRHVHPYGASSPFPQPRHHPVPKCPAGTEMSPSYICMVFSG